MKTIGLIGGVSWASTLEYYKRLNELIPEELDDKGLVESTSVWKTFKKKGLGYYESIVKQKEYIKPKVNVLKSKGLKATESTQD